MLGSPSDAQPPFSVMRHHSRVPGTSRQNLHLVPTTDVGVRRGGTERRLEMGEDDEEDGGAEWTEDEDEGEAQSEAGGEWGEDEGG
jgi:hypothetical protein